MPIISNQFKKNNLIIHHQGHSGDFYHGYKTIEFFLENGYDIITLSLPLLGPNNRPTINLQRFGKFKFTQHEHFKLLDNQNFSSIKFFIEPITTIINYSNNLKFDTKTIVGISGGGWATILSSAIDTRITNSYSIAGSYLFFLKSNKDRNNSGDYEQTEMGLYNITNYLELYLMSATGINRKHTQIVNIFDSCCFNGYACKNYNQILYIKMKEIQNCNFVIHSDSSHGKHIISKNTLNYILNNLNK